MNYVIQGISKRKYSIIDSDKQPRHPEIIMIGKAYYQFSFAAFVDFESSIMAGGHILECIIIQSGLGAPPDSLTRIQARSMSSSSSCSSTESYT